MSNKELTDKLRGLINKDASYEENSAILRAEGEKYAKDGDFAAVAAVGEVMLEIMPEEQKEEIIRLTRIDGVRLDEYYKKIIEHINNKQSVEAKPLAEKLYRKITEEYKDGEEAKFVSLRNPFEDALYHELFKPEKTLNRTPYDFCTYITSYAYIIIETGSTLDAIPVLEKAMEYNPVDCGPKFELAEVYKLIKNKKKLIEITQDTIKVASSPVALARCYANMGYMCTDIGELDDAVAFYTASVMLAPHPAIPLELKGIAQMKGGPIAKPDLEQIKKVFAKYDLEFGPNKDVISVAAALSSRFMTSNDIPNALKALKLLYNLTGDQKIKDIIFKYEPNAKEITRTENVQVENRAGITRTVNENPEE